LSSFLGEIVMAKWLFLPDSVQRDLEILSQSSVESIRNFRTLLDSEVVKKLGERVG